MKIYKLPYPVLLFILLGFLMCAGCKDKSGLLIREWKIEDLKYSRDIPKDMQPRIQQSIDKIKNSYGITYEANGKYHAHMGQEITNGTWKLNWNSSAINTVTDAGVKNEFDIIKLSADEFSFKATEGKEEVIFILVPAK